MMTPYYEEDGIRLFHGDCRELLPSLAPVDLLLTDPPYPGLKGAIDDFNGYGVSARRNLTQTVAEPWGDDLSALALARFTLGAMIFCSWHSVPTLPARIDAEAIALVAWYKRNAMFPIRNVPHQMAEFIWAFKRAPGLNWQRLKTVYDVPTLTAGCISTGERLTQESGKAVHPTQKPLALIGSLLDVEPASVVDPYAGTGTTLVACKQRGIPCVGAELSEAYCELIARRLQSTMRPLFTLDAAPTPPLTLALE